jgi:zinc transport system substrate-binding protein
MKAHLHEDSDHEPAKHEEEHEHHHDNFMADPHIWLSPPMVRVMAIKIRDTLIEADPEHEQQYRNNYFKFANEINTLDTKILNMFAKADKSSFMVYHPSWGYFARNYGLEQIPIELEGKEPSPRELVQLIKFAEKNSVGAIFIQPQFSRKSAESIASSIGAKVLVADPLAEDWAANLEKAAKVFITDSNK